MVALTAIILIEFGSLERPINSQMKEQVTLEISVQTNEWVIGRVQKQRRRQ